MAIVSTVSGEPIAKYSLKLIATPREAAFCTTIKFAIEPRTVNLHANVDAIAATSHAVSRCCNRSTKGFRTSTRVRGDTGQIAAQTVRKTTIDCRKAEPVAITLTPTDLLDSSLPMTPAGTDDRDNP